MADYKESANLPRRGFLRQLAGLPFIGGGIALIGAPIAAAEPVTKELLESYNQWLWHEHSRCANELQNRFGGENMRFTHQYNAGSAFYTDSNWHSDPSIAPASARAAIVLSAVGCDWRSFNIMSRRMPWE